MDNNKKTETENNETPVKASFWTRAKARVAVVATSVGSAVKTAAVATGSAVKTAAVATGSAVKRAAKAVASVMVRAAKAVRAKVRGSKVPAANRLWRVRHATDTTMTKVAAWVRDIWARVLKPFLRLRVIAYGIIVGAVCLVIAPTVTLAVMLTTGLGLWGLSYAVDALNNAALAGSRVASTLLTVIEACAGLALVVAYAATAALTIAMAAVSLPAAIADVLELGLRYFNVSYPVTISTFVFCILTGQWDLVLMVVVLAGLRSSGSFSYITAPRQVRNTDEDAVDVTYTESTNVRAAA